jgi:hypothetical protein
MARSPFARKAWNKGGGREGGREEGREEGREGGGQGGVGVVAGAGGQREHETGGG